MWFRLLSRRQGRCKHLLCCAVWDYFLPAYNCPLKEKIGIDPILGDNGKWLCGVRTLLQRPGCVIYSFGCADSAIFPSHTMVPGLLPGCHRAT